MAAGPRCPPGPTAGYRIRDGAFDGRRAKSPRPRSCREDRPPGSRWGAPGGGEKGGGLCADPPVPRAAEVSGEPALVSHHPLAKYWPGGFTPGQAFPPVPGANGTGAEGTEKQLLDA